MAAASPARREPLRTPKWFNARDKKDQHRSALRSCRTIRDFRIVQTEGTRQVERDIEFYNLDVIISVGYRVKSHRGNQVRIWATQRLREYIIKGFTLDDQRLMQAGGYFGELLERIRAIRASERMFYQKITDIYATSVDYDEQSRVCFSTPSVERLRIVVC